MSKCLQCACTVFSKLPGVNSLCNVNLKRLCTVCNNVESMYVCIVYSMLRYVNCLSAVHFILYATKTDFDSSFYRFTVLSLIQTHWLLAIRCRGCCCKVGDEGENEHSTGS